MTVRSAGLRVVRHHAIPRPTSPVMIGVMIACPPNPASPFAQLDGNGNRPNVTQPSGTSSAGPQSSRPRPAPVCHDTRRSVSSAARNAEPDAIPSSTQSIAANRAARRGASIATTTTGASLSASSVSAAMATCEPTASTPIPSLNIDPSSPAVRAIAALSTPMSTDHGTHAAKNRMSPDHVSVFVRASANHAMTSHTQPR